MHLPLFKKRQAADKTTEEPAHDLYHPTKFNSPVSWRGKGWKLQCDQNPAVANKQSCWLCLLGSLPKNPKPSMHARALDARTSRGKYPCACRRKGSKDAIQACSPSIQNRPCCKDARRVCTEAPRERTDLETIAQRIAENHRRHAAGAALYRVPAALHDFEGLVAWI